MQLARYAAEAVAGLIRDRNSRGMDAVLALPVGSTPVGVYRELIRMRQDEGLDFARVVIFGIDEYYGLAADQLQSCHRWLREHLLDQVNVDPDRVHIPDGTVSPEEVEAYCRRFEAEIEEVGGLDLLLLDVGRNGRIGRNEPFSVRNSRTRLCTLDPVTRIDAASDFFGEENVPTQAVTMGLGTLLQARKILVLALGEGKARVVGDIAEGPVTDRVPASYLQDHPDATLLADAAAAKLLTFSTTPWVCGAVTWTDAMIKRAVLWLCDRTGKSLLKLDDDDFRNHNLHYLLRHLGPAPTLAHRVFRWMMDTIEYHPAGRAPRRVICFSPHPDDDVISMGGTLIRLVEDGHEVHVAYMTSGNIAVFDHDALRVADLVTEYNRLFGIDQQQSREVEARVTTALRGKRSGDFDSLDVLKIKGLIRWSEAKSGALAVGVAEDRLHFLDLPFYHTGGVDKKPISDKDVAIIRQLIDDVQPHQIYVAGDLSDPHGTHRMCAEAIFRALAAMEAAGQALPEVLLYRGAWQEYDLDEIQIAVPLSPGDLERKRKAIFMHESQKDEALFPGSDPREFWQRAEDRNKGTADRYNQIGLPEFFALEAFVRWDGVPI